MKKLREVLPLNDRTKLIVSVSTVGLLLTAAILLPLAFRSVPEEQTAAERIDTAENRAELFAEYWNNGQEATGITVEKPDSVSEIQAAVCTRIFQELTKRCINDHAVSEPTETGREYTVLRREDGMELRLCRMWMELRGDWQNWLDVCFNSENGEVYYIYVSRECISNLNLYQKEQPVAADAEDVAELLAKEYGWTLRYTGTGNGSAASAVFTDRDGGTLCYEIGCRIYDSLVDIKLCCK